MSIENVGITSQEILPKVTSGSKRKQIFLSNREVNTIWIIAGATAVVGEGIPIDQGVNLALGEILSQDKLNLQINAIAETSATDLSVYPL